jgi:hypothetical protein
MERRSFGESGYISGIGLGCSYGTAAIGGIRIGSHLRKMQSAIF